MSSFFKTQEEVKKAREEKVKQLKAEVSISVLNGLLAGGAQYHSDLDQEAVTNAAIAISTSLLGKLGLLKKTEC